MTKILYMYIKSANGYGVSAQSVIDLLSQIDGVELDLVPLNDPNVQQRELQMQYDIGIVHCSTLSAIQDFNQRAFITRSMTRCTQRLHYVLWEADRLPQPYIDFYNNDFVTGLICPSQFCADLVRKAGIAKPIFFIPITVGDNIVKTPRQRPQKFTVLTVAQWSVRKAIDLSVCSYVTAFQGHEDVEYKIGRASCRERV